MKWPEDDFVLGLVIAGIAMAFLTVPYIVMVVFEL
jgi:hypothetical protein